MAIYALLSQCRGNEVQQCSKTALPEILLAITAVVLGVLGMAAMLTMPPPASYALLVLGGSIAIVNLLHPLYLYFKGKPAKIVNTEEQKSDEVKFTPYHNKPSTSETERAKYLPPDDNKQLTTSSYVFFTDQNKLTLFGFDKNTIGPDGLPTINTDAKRHDYPVAASPTHGGSKGVYFDSGSCRPQYILFYDDSETVCIRFEKNQKDTFMKPGVDTMLMCCGINQWLRIGGRFNSAIDVGAGSGFIAKYLALRSPQATVYALDIDPGAIAYMQSEGAAMPPNVKLIEGDALQYLNPHRNGYDLVVSNPPYIPMLAETQSSEMVRPTDANFWEGTAMMSHLLEVTLPQIKGHLLMVVPSTALKSKRIFELFQKGIDGVVAQILYQQEVAFKSWFLQKDANIADAVDNKSRIAHLMATEDEQSTPTHFRGLNLDLFVGITSQKHPRDCRVNDGRKGHFEYQWQMVYIIGFANL